MIEHLGLAELSLIFLFTMVLGIGFSRIKQPPILGYILSGLILGPAGFNYIVAPEIVNFLSELGIIFLMFVVGFELRLEYFKDIWKLSVGATFCQIGMGILVSFIISLFYAWPIEFILLLGFCISLSSTSAVIKILETLDATKSDNGQRAIAILIAQDLAIVPMIMLLKNLTVSSFGFTIVFKLLLSVGLIIGLIMFLSSKKDISLPLPRSIFKDKELVTLMSFASCVAAAWFTGFVGLTEAFGAFLVGLFLGNTAQQKLFLDTIRPVQTILLMIFFFSIGLMIDPAFVWTRIDTFILLLFMVTVGKSIINIAIFHFLKLSWSDAFYLGILLAQIGEFSFMLAKVGKDLKILTNIEERQIVSLTVISLSFSPIWLKMTKRLKMITHVNIVHLPATMEFLFGPKISTFVSKTFYYLGPFWYRKIIRSKPAPEKILQITAKKEDDDK